MICCQTEGANFEYMFLLLNKDIALSEGAVAFALLIGLQFAVTRNSVRVSWMQAW